MRLSDKAMRRLIWILLALALLFMGNAFWIPAKAMLAQFLLQDAWEATLASGGDTYRPWPWADTWPVARLRVPALDVDHIVLEGDTGNTLAFAPGRSMHAALHDELGFTLINAHRDTHFRYLKDIALGEIITLQAPDGFVQAYRVQDMQVVDAGTAYLHAPAQGRWLVLVTCYPFDALQTGGSLRYVVMAEAVEPQTQIANALDS